MNVKRVEELKQQKIDSLKKRVRLIRERTGLGTTMFAKAITASGETIKKAEGEGRLGIDTAICLAEEYNVSLDYLYGLSNVENHTLEHAGRAFEAIFEAEEKEYFQDAMTEITIFNAFSVKCNESLLRYLVERKKLEKELRCAADDDTRKDIEGVIKSVDLKYNQQIVGNGKKTSYILMTEELFEHFLKVVNTEDRPEIFYYKQNYTEAVKKKRK